MKTCTKCGIEKDLSCFYKTKRGLYGLRGECKICSKEIKAAYDLKNKDKIKVYKKEYRLKNSDNIKKYNAEYNLKNKEKIKEYALKNSVKIRDRNAINYKNRNSIEYAKYRKEYFKKNSRNLTDVYVRNSFKGTPAKLIPQELIEVKRQYIRATRLYRNLKNKIKEL